MSSLLKRLEAHGLDVIQAEFWCNLINAVVDAIRSAEKNLHDTKTWSQHCLKVGALHKAKTKKGKPQPSLPSEEGLTDALVEQLQNHRSAVPEGHALRELDIHFESEAHIRSKTRVGKTARRCDIRARSYRLGLASELVFEAKLVDSDQDIRKRYLGNKGLGCFTIPPDPYTREPIGGLIAYTVCKTTPYWSSRIAVAFVESPPKCLSQTSVNVGAKLESMLVSEVAMPLLGLASILMLNIVLRFETNPPREPS